jgi:serine/threonine protein kinase
VRAISIGLHELWSRRVVHRDVKPDNILIRNTDGSPCIIDLGIARLLDRTSLTVSYLPQGPCTPPYAAPEQLTNRKARIDWRTDQFALGIVLAQLLLAGRHAFDPAAVGVGDSVPDNIAGGHWARDLVRAVAGHLLHDVLIKMLGPEPHQRFRTPGSLHEALGKCLEEFAS